MRQYLAPILGDPALATDLTADIDVDVRGEAFADLDSLRGRVGVQSPRLMAAGYVAEDLKLEALVDGRTLEVDGRPDHQELHLDRLDLEARTARWQLAPGATASIQYGGGAVTLDELRLVNGSQQIAADGTFGRPGETLRVTMSGVGLEGVDALWLRDPQLSGSLDLSANVVGTAEGLEASGEFRVTDGAFQQVPYQSFGGTVHYADGVVAFDTRLQQNAEQWLTAKGHLPTALFQASAETAGEDAAVDLVDLTVDSSPIDLGLVQGFTTALTDVSGTLEAHVRLSGTVAAPEPSGAITIQGGALTVVPTGVSYHDLSGRIDLEPERIRIDRIEALDDDGNALSLAGDLAISARQLGGFQLTLSASDFQVLDNEMGDVRIRSALEIGGEVGAPRIEGELGIEQGEIDLDALFAVVGPSAYATTPIATGEEAAPPAPGAFDALTMDVRLVVPDDLVVQSDDLRLPGSAAGLGALDVTLGRSPRDQGVGRAAAARGRRQHRARHLRVPGAALRDPG